MEQTVRYRYRAYPTAVQEQSLKRLFGCCRVVWNDTVYLFRELFDPNGRTWKMRCRICDGLPPEHRPYVVWHTGWDGYEEHDRDYYDEGVVVCADCIEALRYAGIGLDGDACVSDLQCSVDMWAQDTLWHAFWTPERVTVGEADCARRYLDRSGNKDVDPAWDWLPNGTWSDVDEFKADLGSALCRRFLTDDMDGLAAAYLKQGDGWVGTRTQDVWKLAERLGGDACRRI